MGKETTVAIADDHQLFLKSVGMMVNKFNHFTVILDAQNTDTLLNGLATVQILPEILLLDVNLPTIGGIEAARIIKGKYPSIKQVGLSTKDDDITILQMIKAGCCAYLIKEIHPLDFEKALNEIAEKGYYNGDAFNINYRRLLHLDDKIQSAKLSPNEMKFLQLAASELTYKQIAAKMFLAERTIDGYREAVFEKLKVQTRVGMVMEGLRLNLLSLKQQEF